MVCKQTYTEPICQERQEREIADGLWSKCEACGVLSYTKDLQANQMVCGECDHHMRVFSPERIQQLIDATTWKPLNEQVRPDDPLKFKDRKQYSDRLREMQDKTQLVDAVQTGIGQLDSLPVALGVMDFRFMGGSMGSVVGEKLTRLIEYATQKRLPVIIVCASGGARMQEGMLSLMQWKKSNPPLGQTGSRSNS
uniref:Acetyl-Co A carboxylase, Carboxyl transferase n=1 Tax=Oscillatoria sp. CCC 367 TaxID=1550718 RepID=A0A098E5N8_9CYAN|nr:acetyl-Co A carboxylase, Carboxyl transferase [Oscillatoria sp. CCC 367]